MADIEPTAGGSIIDPSQNIQDGYSIENCVCLADNATDKSEVENHPELYYLELLHATKIGFNVDNPNIRIDVTIDEYD